MREAAKIAVILNPTAVILSLSKGGSRAVQRLSLILVILLPTLVILSLSKGRSPALAADPAPTPSLLAATPTFLVYAEGEHRNAAVAGGGAGGYRLLGTLADGSALVSYDDGAFGAVETLSPNLQSRKIKTFARGTAIFRGNDGFLAYEPGSQLLRRYDARGVLVGAPVAALGTAEALGVGDAVVTLGAGRLRVWDRNGRLQHDALMDGNSLVPLPDDHFAVNDLRDSEVRAYTTALEQTATLRYVGLPARAIATAPDGTLAVLAGTPSCNLSNAEIDVFTDLHAQPVARIHDNVTSTSALAVGPDFVYAVNSPCRNGDDGTVAVFTRAGAQYGILRNLGTPTTLLPFTAKRQ
jgi:hypothetical protein